MKLIICPVIIKQLICSMILPDCAPLWTNKISQDA